LKFVHRSLFVSMSEFFTIFGPITRWPYPNKSRLPFYCRHPSFTRLQIWTSLKIALKTGIWTFETPEPISTDPIYINGRRWSVGPVTRLCGTTQSDEL
jgi:hypothetical protein